MNGILTQIHEKCKANLEINMGLRNSSDRLCAHQDAVQKACPNCYGAGASDGVLLHTANSVRYAVQTRLNATAPYNLNR